MALPLDQRRSGVLLHPTSLPGRFSHGDIGPSARQFIEFLESAGQRWWQMLPIHPPGGCDSPYDSPSAFAGSEALISMEDLVTLGLLGDSDLQHLPVVENEERADFSTARVLKHQLLEQAHRSFLAAPHLQSDYRRFIDENAAWVWDYALFSALREAYSNKSWSDWDADLRKRVPTALKAAHQEHESRVSYFVFCQFIFHRQWDELRTYAQVRGVHLMGDVPMFVSYDSSDVWANQDMFFLDETGRQTVQAGVPPDYFSEDGQLWGNPLYRWDRMKETGFGWWLDRLRRELGKFDAIRIDHFIALRRYWEVPVPADNARNGRYVDVPGHEFFKAARDAFGGLPFVAEDLGILTESVEQLRDHFELPGMKVIHFGFFEGAQNYLPHRYIEKCVAYLGTHDNDTSRGWFEQLVRDSQRDGPEAQSARMQLDRLAAYTGVEGPSDVNRLLKRVLLASPANTVILTVQDILDQNTEHRMNVPGTANGNWCYRVKEGALDETIAAELRAIAKATERF